MNIYASIDELIKLAKAECEACAREIEQTGQWIRELTGYRKENSDVTE